MAATSFSVPQPFLSPGPAAFCSTVTPSDTGDITPPEGAAAGSLPRSIWVGGAGNVALIPVANSVSVIFVAVPAGTILPIATRRVLATGTTATNMVAMY